MNNKKEYGIINYIFIALFIVIDRVTKYFAVKYLMPKGMVKMLGGIFNLTYVENTGVAFGMFKGMNYIIVPVSILIVGVCVFYLVKSIRLNEKWVAFSLSLIISGAVGNIIDKFYCGYVVDFIEFGFFEFPVFNFADICVCVGAALLVIIILFSKDGDVFGFDK